MVVKTKAFSITGSILSFLAIFFIAVGSHLFHPFFHPHKTSYNHHVDNSFHHLQVTSIKASKSCPICSFLATAQLSINAPAVLKTELLHLAEKTRCLEFAGPQKPYDQLLPSRAPPFSIHS